MAANDGAIFKEQCLITNRKSAILWGIWSFPGIINSSCTVELIITFEWRFPVIVAIIVVEPQRNCSSAQELCTPHHKSCVCICTSGLLNSESTTRREACARWISTCLILQEACMRHDQSPFWPATPCVILRLHHVLLPWGWGKRSSAGPGSEVWLTLKANQFVSFKKVCTSVLSSGGGRWSLKTSWDRRQWYVESADLHTCLEEINPPRPKNRRALRLDSLKSNKSIIQQIFFFWVAEDFPWCRHVIG